MTIEDLAQREGMTAPRVVRILTHPVPRNLPLEKRRVLKTIGPSSRLYRVSNRREKWRFSGKLAGPQGMLSQ